MFVTYYLQQSLGFSAVQTGLAFLPWLAAFTTMSQVGSRVIAKRVVPRWTIAPGVAAAGLASILFSHLGVSSTYAVDILPALVLFGELGWNASQRPRDLGVRSGRGEAPPVLSERRGVSAIRQGRALCGGAERDGVSEGLKSLHEASDLDLGVAM